jgi:prolipoprotein diacylglyceryltransferase
LAEAALLTALALGLTAVLRSPAPWAGRSGRVIALYLAGAGVIRLTLELFRGDDRGWPLFFGLPPTTWGAALTLAAGLIVFSLRRPAPADPARPEAGGFTGDF